MLSDKKLNEESFAGKNIQSLPNTPSTAGITTQQLKAAFDRVGEKIIAVAVNGMIDDLVGVEGGANIGVTGGGTVQEHLDSRFNPHNVTKGQVGLGEVTNTADMDKPVSTLQAAAIALKCDVAYVDEQDAATYDAAKEYADSLAFTSGLVTSVFGRAGAVEAQSGDYTPDMVGAAKFESGVFQLTHVKTDTVHTLTGTIPTADIVTAKFKATADFAEGNSFTLNGIAFAAQDSLGEEIAGFKSGAVVGIEIDVAGKKLNFKSGGGGGASAQLPSPLTSFSASAGNAQATYTLGYDATDTALSGIFLVRKVGSMPTGLSDGVKLDIGKVTTYTDKGLVNGTTYYVRAFPYNSKKQVQNALDNAVVSFQPSEGILMSELPVGTLVVDLNTKYYDVPIVWKIADQNHSGYPSNSTTLISDKILTLKCFDAKEPTNSDGNRKNYGNNRYIYANVRQWLNSGAAAGKWYTKQHTDDTPPNSTNVTANPYDAQAGFLNSFSNGFQNTLLPTVLIVAKAKVDGGGSETLTDKLFLASNTEVGLGNENNITEGIKLSLFSDNASRVETPTTECVSNSTFTDVNLNASKGWHWWLRTPSASFPQFPRNVFSSGILQHDECRSGRFGIRPLCNIPNTTLVSLAPNAQGQYEILF